MEEGFSNLEQARLEKLRRLRAQGIDPYPPGSSVTHTTAEAIQAFEASEAAVTASGASVTSAVSNPEAVTVTLAGRIRATRPMGKVVFAHIEDRAGRIQLFFRVNELGADQIEFFNREFDLGDFVQASGFIFRTRTGEITLHVKAFNMLSKALLPLPAAKDEVVDGQVVRHATLADPETRFRRFGG